MYAYQCKCGLSVRLHLDDRGSDVKEESRLLNEIEKGNFGERYKKTCEKYPDGYIDAHRELYKCSCCGEWVEASVKDFYVPVSKYEDADRGTIAINNSQVYKRKIRFNHICRKCGRKVRTVPHNKRFDELFRCQNCGKENHINYYTRDTLF